MATEREVQEAAARGVAVMVHYRNDPRTKSARGLMVVEVQAIAEWAGATGQVANDARRRIVEAVRVGLLLRYADAEAIRLLDEFVGAFAGESGLMLRKA